MIDRSCAPRNGEGLVANTVDVNLTKTRIAV